MSNNRILTKTDFVWLPAPEEEMLLKAGLENGAAAAEAWLEYKAKIDFEKISGAEKRLFPLVYHNLRQNKFTDELTGFLKDAHREAYKKVAFNLQRAADLTSLLAQNNIETILLKGAALGINYYPSAALRPMSDVDLMIKPKDFAATVEILKTRNWRTNERNLSLIVEIIHACQFFDEEDFELDLHWRLMGECWNADKNETFWDSAVMLKHNSLETKALCATDQLFHVCRHGARYNLLSPVRWVADAVMILRSADEIDWQRLLRLAQFYRFSLPLFHALNYLKGTFNAPIPSNFLESMGKIPKTRLEIMSFKNSSQVSKPWSRWRYLQEVAFQYASLRSSTKLKPRSIVFLKYLKNTRTFEKINKKLLAPFE